MRVGRLTSDDHSLIWNLHTQKGWADISQGSVATHLRFGRIFSDSVITNFRLILTVK